MALVVAASTGGVACVVLGANPRKSWNQWLSFFLFLVCGNFAAQTLDAYTRLQVQAGAVDAATAQAWLVLLQRVAHAFLAFDPAVLAYFASIFPRRSKLLERPWGLPLLALPALAALAAEAGWQGLSRPSPVAATAFFGYFAACYAYAAWRLLKSFAQEPSSVMAEQLQPVVLGVMVVALPRLALLPDDLQAAFLAPGAVRTEAFQLLDLAFRIGALVSLLLACRAAAARMPTAAGRRAMMDRTFRSAAAMFGAFAALWSVGRLTFVWRYSVTPPHPPPWGVPLGDIAEVPVYGVRWLAFSAAMVLGIVRYATLSVDLLAPSLTQSVAAGLASACLVGAAAVIFGPLGASLVACGLTVGAGLLLVRVRASHDGHRYLHRRALEVYRASVAAALAAADAGAALGALEDERVRLGISRSEHDALAAVAQAEEARGKPVAPGFGRYTVLRRLGVGGTASVHLARDGETGDFVVLKHVRAAWAGDRGAEEAALRELEVARRVSHPSLVAVHGFMRADDGVVLVLEHAEGGSLRGLLRERGCLAPAEVARLAADAADGLAALHAAGVVHGDIKPENILLDSAGRAKLTDFGLASATPSGTTLIKRGGDGVGLGTPGYLAPERLRGGAPTPAADVYALGAVLHEAITGSAWTPEGAPPGGHARHPGWPASWAPPLGRALAEEPARRFADGQALRDALPEPSQGLSQGTRRAGAAGPRQPGRRDPAARRMVPP